MKKPNLTVEDTFKSAAIGVYKATGEKQLPWQQGIILGDFYFSRSNEVLAPPIESYVPLAMKRVHLTLKTSPEEVTVGEFRKFVRATGYRTQAEQNVKQQGCYAYSGSASGWDWRSGYDWDQVGFNQNDQHPVVCVSGRDVQHYIA